MKPNNNHVNPQELFKQLPQQRKLSDEEKEEAAKYLSLKANKKMLQDKLATSTGKSIVLKDLSNLKEKMKAGKSRNDLDMAVKQLSEKHG